MKITKSTIKHFFESRTREKYTTQQDIISYESGKYGILDILSALHSVWQYIANIYLKLKWYQFSGRSEIV